MYKILLKTAGFLIIPFTSFANQRCDSFKSEPEIITSINYCAFGEIRLYLFLGFVLGFFIERLSIGFLVAKSLKFI